MGGRCSSLFYSLQPKTVLCYMQDCDERKAHLKGLILMIHLINTHRIA